MTPKEQLLVVNSGFWKHKENFVVLSQAWQNCRHIYETTNLFPEMG